MTETPLHTIVEAFAMQARASGALGSPMYASLLRELGERYSADPAAAVLRQLLTDRTMRPVHDAVVLRLVGAVHRIVLRGAAPDLAAHYPTVGGQPNDGFIDDFLNVVIRHRDEIDQALDEQVQTNEVGRSAVLVGGFALIGRVPLDRLVVPAGCHQGRRARRPRSLGESRDVRTPAGLAADGTRRCPRQPSTSHLARRTR